MRRIPKSHWRSSPLSGLEEPDDLRLSAEARHHRRNISKREQETWVQIAADLGTSPPEPGQGFTALTLDQPGQNEEEEEEQEQDDAAEHFDNSPCSGRRVGELDDPAEDQSDPEPSFAVISGPKQAYSQYRSTNTRNELFPNTSPSGPKMPLSLHNDIAVDLHVYDKEQHSNTSNELGSDGASEWSIAPSSVDLHTQEWEDDETPPVEEPWTLAQAARLFPSTEWQYELEKIYALLRNLVQVEPDKFTVVDPHDFLQVLSCNGLHREEKGKLDIVQRLRRQLTYRPSSYDSSLETPKPSILLPFISSGKVLLGYVKMRGIKPGIVEVYSADPEWVEGPGSDFKDKRNHPIFHVQSFIENIFPDTRAKTWEWLMPVHTALVRTDLVNMHLDPELLQDVEGGTGGVRNLHYLLPIFTQGLIMLSGAEPLQDTMVNHMALACLVSRLHFPGGNHLLWAIRSEFTETMRLYFGMPIRDAHVKAFVELEHISPGDPHVIIKGMMRARKRIREGIAMSRRVAASLTLHYKELSHITETLSHRMMDIVAEVRYHHLDNLLERSNYPWNPSVATSDPGEQQLPDWQFREAAAFYDRLQAMRNECESFRTDYEEAIRDVLLALEEY